VGFGDVNKTTYNDDGSSMEMLFAGASTRNMSLNKTFSGPDELLTKLELLFQVDKNPTQTQMIFTMFICYTPPI
jgi:hypothetical protein